MEFNYEELLNLPTLVELKYFIPNAFLEYPKHYTTSQMILLTKVYPSKQRQDFLQAHAFQSF